MSALYSSAGWPLLLSKTEQKQKSGILAVSAEFICPADQISVPTDIDTSYGSVEVWPEPSVTTGTDGFARINATGYGQWSSGSQITYGYETFEVRAYYAQYYLCKNPDGCGDDLKCGEYRPSTLESSTVTIKLLKETALVKQIGAAPPPAPPLRVIGIDGLDIKGFTLAEFGVFIAPSEFTGYFDPVMPVMGPPILQSFKQNIYGKIIESEAIYSVSVGHIFFGDYYEIPKPSDCQPAP
jgi:hypothetical protein